MSASNNPASAVSPLSEDLVRDYLKEHGDFLQRNPDLLDHLHVSHASGSAVSLVEKQISVLRERNTELRHRLKSLTANAEENDRLYDRTRSLVLKLLEADSLDALYRTFMDSLRDDFEVEHASMILFGEPGSAGECRMDSPKKARKEIGALLKGRKAVCGAMRKEELAYLFPGAGAVGSAALVPLAHGEELGLIAVGSSDADRYNSAVGTLFLSHIAEVIVRLLSRLRHGDG